MRACTVHTRVCVCVCTHTSVDSGRARLCPLSRLYVKYVHRGQWKRKRALARSPWRYLVLTTTSIRSPTNHYGIAVPRKLVVKAPPWKRRDSLPFTLPRATLGLLRPVSGGERRESFGGALLLLLLLLQVALLRVVLSRAAGGAPRMVASPARQERRKRADLLIDHSSIRESYLRGDRSINSRVPWKFLFETAMRGDLPRCEGLHSIPLDVQMFSPIVIATLYLFFYPKSAQVTSSSYKHEDLVADALYLLEIWLY